MSGKDAVPAGGVRAVRALLASVFVLMAGGGVLATLVAIRLRAQAAGPLVEGAVAAAYFAGLTAGSVLMPRVIGRVGHIRAFAAFASVYSASTLAYALAASPLMWAGLRTIDGLCLAGVFVCVESWLNETGSPEARGRILSFYMIALYVGQALAQFQLYLEQPGSRLPFMVASILLSLAVVPVVLTRQPQPPPPRTVGVRLGRLYRASPLGLVGAAVTGLIMGGFYGLVAIFCRGVGLSVRETAIFVSTVIFGGVLWQWPLGRLSDVLDRRWVIVGILLATAMASAAVAVSGEWPAPARLATAGLFGAVSFALYPLCVAHANERVADDERVATSSGLVLAYSVGAIAGPLLASGAMLAFGPTGLFSAISVMAAATFGFALWRLAVTEALPSDRRQRFLALPRTTHVATAEDPFSAS